MAKFTTLSTQVFDAAKSTAIKSQLIRKEINLSEFNVVDNNHIKIDGITVEMTSAAFNKLLGRLRIPKAFAKRFVDGFGEDGLRKLVEMMKTNKAAHNDQTITLLVNPESRKITNFLPEGYASVSNESFFDFASGYIDQYDLGVTHATSDNFGNCQINCISEKGIYRVPGNNNEVFQTGVTFRNTPVRGLEVSPFMNRLICTNGLTSTEFSESYNLHSLTDKNISEFNDAMIRMASTGFQPAGLTDIIRKAQQTDASLAEMQKAVSSILSVDNRIDYNYIQRYIPLDRVTKAYEMAGVHTSELTNKQLVNAKSGMTMWDMINAITNFASNDKKWNVNEANMANLMVTAGNILCKKSYDTESLLSINDPFANTPLLTQEEAAHVRGDL